MQQFIQLGWMRRDAFCALKGIPRESFKKTAANPASGSL